MEDVRKECHFKSQMLQEVSDFPPFSFPYCCIRYFWNCNLLSWSQSKTVRCKWRSLYWNVMVTLSLSLSACPMSLESSSMVVSVYDNLI